MDHPTRHLPESERPDTTTPAPTTRLDGHGSDALPDCPRCGGAVVAFGLRGAVVENRQAPVDRWTGLPLRAGIAAHVCLACGYTELYTIQPDQLLPDQ
jgi:hypothetical protein